MKKREQIVKYFLENPNKSLKDIGEVFDLNKGEISKILTKTFSYSVELYFCFSVYFPDLGFLFDGFTERKVILRNNEVLNKDDFEDEELMWLLYNFNIGKYIEFQEFSYVDYAVRELQEQLSNTTIFIEKKKLIEKIKILQA